MSTRSTPRLAELRARPQKHESLDQALEHIEQHACSIVHVSCNGKSLDWTYSTGLYDTYGQPEIILTGFPQNPGKSVINTIRDLYAAGTPTPTDTRIPNLLGDVDCILRPIIDEWKHRLMLRCNWFYGDHPYPALQCICPDLQNRFPWEPGFDTRWLAKQAFLQSNQARTEAELDLWANSAQ
jgi:hypothetical protein